jgi:hypothetical protein
LFCFSFSFFKFSLVAVAIFNFFRDKFNFQSLG